MTDISAAPARACVCRRVLAAGETLCQRCRAATHGRLRRMPALY
ncbi:hypothetical protein ACTVZO_17680 [Streptomyces sp. IBSNAI002]